MRLIIVFLLLAFELSFGQQYPYDKKRDFVWMFGYDHSPPYFGGSCLNFNQFPVSSSYVTQEINMDGANACVCDTSGNLLFYTNSMYVANANHQIMPNGDSLNPGAVFNWYEDYGYRLPQGVIILPLPGSSHIYYIIHQKLEFSDEYFMIARSLYYTIVDMDLDSGLGEVISKNNLFIDDTLDMGCLTATRHANGRDWWLLVPKFKHNEYYRILFSPSGLLAGSSQTIGTASNENELGQACFSHDGSKYVRYAGIHLGSPYRLEVFDFDRCSGTLSNYRNLWYTDTAWALGVAISPNSQFMYVSADKRIDQYDLSTTNISASRQVVATYDGFTDPLFPAQTRFFLAQLAPDNKIYICTPGGTRYLHVIDQPNNEGISCNVLQHAILLNTFNASSMPNIPNFRLGPIDNTICDSLGIDVITSISTGLNDLGSILIWPNPASTYFNYEITTTIEIEPLNFLVLNNLGTTVWQRKIDSNQNIGNFDNSDISNGCYLLVIKNGKGTILGSKKIMVIK